MRKKRAVIYDDDYMVPEKELNALRHLPAVIIFKVPAALRWRQVDVLFAADAVLAPCRPIGRTQSVKSWQFPFQPRRVIVKVFAVSAG